MRLRKRPNQRSCRARETADTPMLVPRSADLPLHRYFRSCLRCLRRLCGLHLRRNVCYARHISTNNCDRSRESNMTNLTSIASLKRFHLSLSGAPAALALGVALAAAPTWLIAETQVHGTPKAVSVHAENASIEEILVALTNTFNVQFR